MTITLSLPILILLGISVVLFIATTLLCFQQGLFDNDSYGIGAMFALLIYAILWAIPSVLAWAIWATWIKP